MLSRLRGGPARSAGIDPWLEPSTLIADRQSRIADRGSERRVQLAQGPRSESGPYLHAERALATPSSVRHTKGRLAPAFGASA